jgi:hypothetical protein
MILDKPELHLLHSMAANELRLTLAGEMNGDGKHHGT